MSKMTSGVASAPLAQVDAPLLAFALGQGSVLPTSLADLDRAAGGVVARVITSGDFKGKRDETTLAVHRRDVHDATPALAVHVRDRVLRQKEGADEHDADEVLPAILRELFDRCHQLKAGVVHQDVDAAPFLSRS